MLVWEQTYKTGVPAMDAEHLILFSLLNQIDINIEKNEVGCLNDVLGALETYIDYHFAHEEELLLAKGFPDLPRHAEVHRKFLAEVRALRDRVAEDDVLIAAAMRIRFLVMGWLIDHILEDDVAYAAHLARQEVSASSDQKEGNKAY